MKKTMSMSILSFWIFLFLLCTTIEIASSGKEKIGHRKHRGKNKNLRRKATRKLPGSFTSRDDEDCAGYHESCQGGRCCQEGLACVDLGLGRREICKRDDIIVRFTDFPSYAIPSGEPSEILSYIPSATPSHIPSAAMGTSPAEISTAPSYDLRVATTLPSSSSESPTGAPSLVPSSSIHPSIISSISPSFSGSPISMPSTSPSSSIVPSISPSATPTSSDSPSTTLPTSSRPPVDPSIVPSSISPTIVSTTTTDNNDEEFITVVKFLAFGDTPYDEEVGYPFINGPDYNCLEQVVLPGAKNMADEVDFIVHVGDIKKGAARYSSYCDDEVFGNRRDLFSMVEPDLDFLLLVGDNEWNECDGYDTEDPHFSDEVKTRWRQYFTTGDYANMRSSLPWGGDDVDLIRDYDHPENFFFYYTALDIAFFGITMAANEPNYNSINADWIIENLEGKTPNAVVIFGHARISSSSPILTVAIPRDVPTFYVQGNTHQYSIGHYFSDSTRQSEWPLLGQLTVPAFKSQPFEVSILKYNDGRHFFGVRQMEFDDPNNLCW